MDLRAYESSKFELAEILRELAAFVPPHGELAASLGELFTRLAEDRFNLVVVGRFSRGKTSLMNAVLGMDRLPTGILPLTSVITSVTYSSREEVGIEFEQSRFEYEITMSQLAEYITERGNPGNVKRIARARIGLPVELLRRGFQFVDTPGLSSAIAANERTTEAFLPQADALVMVSGYDGALSDDELRLARQMVSLNRRLFFVLNKHDLVSAAERQQVLDYVRERLTEALPARAPELYSVSARDGLTAKLAGDQVSLAASGIAALEAALTHFLIEDKAGEFLRGLCDRTARLMDALEQDARIATLRVRLLTLRERGRQAQPSTNVVSDAPALPVHGTPKIEDCLICRRVTQSLFDFLSRYQYELIHSSTAREAFTAAGGLCAAHLRAYASLAAERDICVALEPLMQRTSARLAEVAALPHSGLNRAPLDVGQATAQECAVCRLQRDTEDTVAKELSAMHAHAAADVGRPLPSLCLAHLRVLSVRSSDQALVTALISRQARAVERLTEDMRRYVLKRDGIRHGLASEEELQAAKLTIAFMAGR